MAGWRCVAFLPHVREGGDTRRLEPLEEFELALEHELG